MVRRIVSLGFAFVLVACLTLPCFADDQFAYPIDVLGFGFESENGINIVADNGIVSGSEFRNFVSDTSVAYNPTYFDVYIAYPVHYSHVTVTVTTRAFDSTNTCSVGTLSYSNGYVPVADCSVSATLRGTPYLDGTRCRTWTFRIAVPDVTQTVNFIRLRLTPPENGFLLTRTVSGDNITGTLSALNGSTSSKADSLTGSIDMSGFQAKTNLASGDLIPGNSTFTIAKNGVSLSGSTTAVYVNGRLRYDSSSSYTLGSTTSSSTPWLQIPSQTISVKNANAITGTVTNTSGSIFVNEHYINGTNSSSASLGGTNTIPSIDFSGNQQSFTGSVGDVSVNKTVIHVQATGFTNDSDLIDAVETGFAQNHQDLTNISSKLGQLVDHQTQVDTTGTQIGSTTSTQTITGTSGDLTTGAAGLDESISTVTDIGGFITSATPYMNLLNVGLTIMFQWGDGIILWAVLATIVLSVLLFIIGRISE